MKDQNKEMCGWALLSITLFVSACAHQPAKIKMRPTSEVVGVPIVVTNLARKSVKPGSRIVIAEITGDCAQEVKDAIMQRLIDNPNYDVLTRDNLNQILLEGEMKWGGDFNSTTGARIGELLSASLFIVGRVVRCGPIFEGPEGKPVRNSVSIIAHLQILDLETGKVILSSASEGKYEPGKKSRLVTEKSVDDDSKEGEGSGSTLSRIQDIGLKVLGPDVGLASLGASPVARVGGEISEKITKNIENIKGDSEPEKENYPKLKAAEDMANGFASKFFSRPEWTEVEMWENNKWLYGDSINYVRLGRCPQAVELLGNLGSLEVRYMSDVEVGEFLHNLGVTLLCANEPEKAMRKLRSAYRVSYKKVTLRMIALASKILEWSLNVEVDVEPETAQLLEKGNSGRATPGRH